MSLDYQSSCRFDKFSDPCLSTFSELWPVMHARYGTFLVHIGMNDMDKEGDYVWSDGLVQQVGDINFWAFREPRFPKPDDCGAIQIGNLYSLTDRSCCAQLGHMCERASR